MSTLLILTKCQHEYRHDGVSNVRVAKRELRWTNARAEKRQMARVFIDRAYLDDEQILRSDDAGPA